MRGCGERPRPARRTPLPQHGLEPCRRGAAGGRECARRQAARRPGSGRSRGSTSQTILRRQPAVGAIPVEPSIKGVVNGVTWVATFSEPHRAAEQIRHVSLGRALVDDRSDVSRVRSALRGAPASPATAAVRPRGACPRCREGPRAGLPLLLPCRSECLCLRPPQPCRTCARSRSGRLAASPYDEVPSQDPANAGTSPATPPSVPIR